MAKPKIKLEVANFIAKIQILKGVQFNTHDLIVNGHRGLMVLTESDLVKEFYKVKEFVNSKDFYIPEPKYSHWAAEKPTAAQQMTAIREEAARIEAEIVEKFLLL